MTTATLRLSTPLPEARTAPKRGLFARFIDAIIEARMRRAMREIAQRRYLVPEHTLKGVGHEATLTNDSALPFTR
jgi:hypothetical protein